MTSTDIVVGLDIGTSKICAIIGRKNQYGKIEVLSISRTESQGVTRGVVSNIEKTVQSIKTVIQESESKTGAKVTSVYVGIAGQHIKSHQHRGIIVRDNVETEVNQADVDKLIEGMYKLVMLPGEEIIHVIPQEYIVDSEQGIKYPIGMSGVRLEANFHIITGQITAAKNIYKCINKAGLEVVNLILEPLASSESVLSEEEKEAGVVLVDMGGGTTDIAVFQDGIIRHTAVIPFGGNSITQDIKEGCSLMHNQAELLKIKFGSALASENLENEIVAIPGLRGREPKEISLKNLAHIIQARVEEIMEHVYYEIKNSGFEKKLIGGIVITGGGAQLKHMSQLIEYVTGMDSRVGYPNEHLAHGAIEESKSPMYATGIGLVIKGLQASEIRAKKIATHSDKTKDSWFNSLLKKSKDWLIEENDKDFEK